MGWKTGAAAGAAAGMWGGPIGAAIGAGVGAFIGNLCDDDNEGEDGNENQEPISIYLTEKGLSFPIANLTVFWGEVLEVEFDNDKGYDVYKLIGGIQITCPSQLVAFADPDKADEINETIRGRSVQSVENIFDSIDEDSTVDDLLSVANASVASVAVCKETLRDLQSDENLIVDFNECPQVLYWIGCGLRRSYAMIVQNDNFDVDDAEAVQDWAAENKEGLVALGDYFAEAISDDDHYSQNEACLKMCSAQIADYQLIVSSYLSPRDFDKSDYALFHTSASVENSVDNVATAYVCIEWLARKFTSEEYAKERKIIICTDEPRVLAELKTEIPGVSILRADTLEMAKDRVNEPFDVTEELDHMDIDESLSKSRKLELAKAHYDEVKKRAFQFEVGHPKNGVTYVQHPLVQNRYIDIQSYNTSLLEWKYDELIDILTSIGASSISCSVENEQSSGRKNSCRRTVEGEFSTGPFGSASGSYNGQSFSERTSALNKRLACSITRKPNQNPQLPKNTIFYPFEERWQMMVKDVLSGQRTHEEVDLSYRKEYSLSGNETRKIAGKIESLIPSFQFGGSANYSDEYEAELRELESIVWHYVVDFGSEKSSESDEVQEKQPDSADVPNTSADRVEGLILKRARQYAKVDGVDLTEEHRKTLFEMGEKYGVDELRIEELIADACE